MILKPRIFKHIIRLNVNTPKAKAAEFRKDLQAGGRDFELAALGKPPEELKRSPEDSQSVTTTARKASKRLVKKYKVDNLTDWCVEHWGTARNAISAKWLGDYVLYVNTDEMLFNTLTKLAKKYKVELFFSYVEDSNINVEDSCGFGRVGKVNELLELPDDKFEKFVFGTILMREWLTGFKPWEDTTIEGSVSKYYIEHFMEENARNKIKEAFDSKLADLANAMVTNIFGGVYAWGEVADCYKKVSLPFFILHDDIVIPYSNLI